MRTFRNKLAGPGRFLALALCLCGQVCTGQITNGIGLAWTPPPPVYPGPVTTRVFIGTNSSSYQKFLEYTSTNAWLPVTALAYGTNFVNVATVQYLADNQAVVSGYSSVEVQIVRIAPPTPFVVTFSNAVLSSSNLVQWTAASNVFSIGVTDDQPAQFYRANPAARATIHRQPDSIQILPPFP